jgi:2-(1,2-epoxy-1,2-dihydrophenyl)acetyl-CoA isomerase
VTSGPVLAAAPVGIEREGRISTISLRRPARANALSEALIDELPRVLVAEASDHEVGAIVLTGDGPHFCAGGDIGHRLFTIDDPAVREPLIRAAYLITEALLDLEVPVVVAVNGACAGAAMAMVAAADIRVAAASARFSLDFVKLGLLPDMGICHLLPRDIGVAATLELALLGDRIDAHDAQRLGLVSRVVADEALLPTAHELAARLAGTPPETLRTIRHAVRELPDRPRDVAFADEAAAMNRLIGSPDAQERLADFSRKKD